MNEQLGTNMMGSGFLSSLFELAGPVSVLLAGILTDELRTKMEEATPMGRIGTVEDVAACALYLASPAGGWVTGKIFEVDGGTETTNFRMPTAEL